MGVFIPIISVLAYMMYSSMYKFNARIIELMKVDTKADGTEILMPTGRLKKMRFGWQTKEQTILETLGKKKRITPEMIGRMLPNNTFYIGLYLDKLIPIDFMFDGKILKTEIIPNVLRHDSAVMNEEEMIEFSNSKKWYENPVLVAIIWVVLIVMGTVAWVWIMWKFSSPDLGSLQANTNMMEKLAGYMSNSVGVAPA